jgi:hypothetical protein
MTALGVAASDKPLNAAEKLAVWTLLSVGGWAVLLGAGFGVARLF